MRQIALVLLFLILVFLIFPFFLPEKVEVITEKEINFPKGIVFEEFNDMKLLTLWLPWTSTDSLVRPEILAPTRGKNSGIKWKTNKEPGQLYLTESAPIDSLKFKVSGFNMVEDSEMKVLLKSNEIGQTNLTWEIISRDLGYFSRFYGLYLSNRLKKEMETGIEQLTYLLKTEPINSQQAKFIEPGTIAREDFEGYRILALKNKTSVERKALKKKAENSLKQISDFLKNELNLSDEDILRPILYFESEFSEDHGFNDYSAFLVKDSLKNTGEEMKIITIPPQITLISLHKGKYEKIDSTIGIMKNYAMENGFKLKKNHWELLLKESDETEESITKIYLPIAK